MDPSKQCPIRLLGLVLVFLVCLVHVVIPRGSGLLPLSLSLGLHVELCTGLRGKRSHLLTFCKERSAEGAGTRCMQPAAS